MIHRIATVVVAASVLCACSATPSKSLSLQSSFSPSQGMMRGYAEWLRDSQQRQLPHQQGKNRLPVRMAEI